MDYYVESGEGIERQEGEARWVLQLQWNPVKELKDICRAVMNLEPDVESGEGIESSELDLNREPLAHFVVESGEGIERDATVDDQVWHLWMVESGEGIERS